MKKDTYDLSPRWIMRRQKLTLSVDADVIEKAKAFSRRHQTSVSKLVTRFLGQLDHTDGLDAPVVGRLRGVLPADTSRAEQRRDIERKHWR